MYAINTSLAGMTSAIRRFDRAATDIAQGSAGVSSARASDTPIEQAIVETISAQRQLQANAAVMRTGYQMLGSLIDIKV